MKKLIRNHTNPINSNFDGVKYISKSRRSIQSLQKMLIFRCAKYKQEILSLQTALMNKYGQPLRIEDQEYIACAIAAKGRKNACFGTSHKLPAQYNLLLQNELKKLGAIGGMAPTNGTRNIIGKCAEVKSANQIMNSNDCDDLKKIQFTQAIRPRTMQKIPRCPNCVTVFGDEK
jgi:hypothetical protein